MAGDNPSLRAQLEALEPEVELLTAHGAEFPDYDERLIRTLAGGLMLFLRAVVSIAEELHDIAYVVERER